MHVDLQNTQTTTYNCPLIYPKSWKSFIQNNACCNIGQDTSTRVEIIPELLNFVTNTSAYLHTREIILDEIGKKFFNSGIPPHGSDASIISRNGKFHQITPRNTSTRVGEHRTICSQTMPKMILMILQLFGPISSVIDFLIE